MKYDYLVVGAGLFGAVCARELADAGKRVLVIEREPHVGGACRTEVRDGIICQSHGGHIFHTNDRRLWDYVNRFAEFRQYEHRVKVYSEGTVFSFPPNRMTFQQMCLDPHSPDSAAIMKARLFAGYTAKQWGKPIDEVPESVLQRIPWRTTWDDRYFTDAYQGLPTQGYTDLIEAMLAGIRVLTGEDYLARRTYWDAHAPRVIYTGPVDALLGYQLGRLEYRGLRFEWERHEVADYQGCPTMNYADAGTPWTRIHEHKHFYPAPRAGAHTWITLEHPVVAGPDAPPYYPVADRANQERYAAYAQMAAGFLPHVRLGGRLGSFQYLDMHQAIAAALRLVEKEMA